jgi:3-hydroxyisobutyrate dehydrogenase
MPASSPAGVAQLSSTIVTMLPSSPQVQEVYAGENGILAGLASLGDPASNAGNSTLCIDSTTLDPKVAKEVSDMVKQAGRSSQAGKHANSDVGSFDMIDAPVSGGVVGARGERALFDTVKA